MVPDLLLFFIFFRKDLTDLLTERFNLISMHSQQPVFVYGN